MPIPSWQLLLFVFVFDDVVDDVAVLVVDVAAGLDKWGRGKAMENVFFAKFQHPKALDFISQGIKEDRFLIFGPRRKAVVGFVSCQPFLVSLIIHEHDFKIFCTKSFGIDQQGLKQ